MNYILNEDGEPVREPDILSWARWYEKAHRALKKTDIDGQHVSTVFLGISYQCNPDGPPILYETMIFPACEYCDRYATKDEAIAGHAKAVEWVKAGCKEEGVQS